MLFTSIVDAAVQSRGRKTACQSPVVMVDAGIKGCCQAKEWVRWSLVGSVDSWGNWWVLAGQACSSPAIQNHKLGMGEVQGVHGGGLPSDASGGRSSATPTLYSESGELLTLTGNLLNPTDTRSVEEAEVEDSKSELIDHSRWSHWGSSVALQWQWMRSILSNPSLWMLWSCLYWHASVASSGSWGQCLWIRKTRNFYKSKRNLIFSYLSGAATD